MSYISVSGQKSSSSSNNVPFSTKGNTIPVGALVSGTTYKFLSWDLNANSGVNGAGTYIFALNFEVDGDATTAFSQVILDFYINEAQLWNTEVFVKTTLPNANPHSIYIPFIYQHSQEDINVEIDLTATFAGTAPTIPVGFGTTIYKIS